MKRFLLVYEGPADDRTATTLADRKLRSSGPQWLRDLLAHSLEEQREWLRELSGTKSQWKNLAAICEARGVRVPHGRFGTAERTPDSVAARKAVFLARTLGDVDALVLVRDVDDQPERATGLEQARTLAAALSPAIPVVIGLANPKREAWVLATFVADSNEERTLLTNLRQELGFDPCRAPHRLAAKHPGSKTDVKRVLHVLAQGDSERERRCLEDTPMDALEATNAGSLAAAADRLRDCGLAAFLKEVAERLSPVLAG